MIVRVISKDISNGLPNWSLSCPVALALRRATGQLWKVTPYRAINLCRNFEILLPNNVTKFIVFYDKFGIGEPFSFSIEITDADKEVNNARKL